MADKKDRFSKRLHDAVDSSYEKLKKFRETRLRIIRQYVGNNYGDNGAEKHVPLNMMRLAATLYARKVSPRAPKAMVRTRHREYKAKAFDLERNLNDLLTEIRFEKTLQACVLDAILSPFGIIKTGVTPKEHAEWDGILHDGMQTYADSVDLDDWVHDTSVKRIDQCGFLGSKMRVDLEYAKECPLFDKAAREKLNNDEGSGVTGGGAEKVENISRTRSGSHGSEYRDHVELWEFWFPRENVVRIYPVDGDWGEPLREEKYEGPEQGPYHMLGFFDVPNNIMPSSPASDWLDRHDLINTLARKLRNQAERQKENTVYQGAAVGDAQKLKDASDGEMISSMNPQGVAKVKSGGIAQENFGYMVWLMDRFSKDAGNLDALGGLGAQTETFGQDKLIHDSVSEIVNTMRDRVVDFTRSVYYSTAHYLWTDPMREFETVRGVPGYEGVQVKSRLMPEDRNEDDLLQYNIQIDPYSMQPQTPASKLASLEKFVQGYLMPMLPILGPQGIGPNFEKILRLYAKYTDMDEMEDIIQFQEPNPIQSGSSDSGGSFRPPNTTRTNVRVNKSTATTEGKDKNLVNTMMGGTVQASERGMV